MRRLAAACALIATLAVPSWAGAVVGGHGATRAYPHMAALRYDGEFICGASLVAPSIILTAAHCVMGEDGKPVPPSHLSFTLGRTQLDGPGGETIGASNVEVHERYGDPKGASHDIALVTLARASSAAQAIRLADPSADRARWAPGQEATVTGWGTRAFGDVLALTATNDLQEVQVPMVADSDCATSYSITQEFEPTTMVCAGELTGMKDACQGDSGGPLMVSDGSGGLLLVGTVSFGTGCGYPTQYGVYGRVGDRALHDWIAARLPRPAVAPATTTAASGVRSPAPRTAKARRARSRKARCARAIRRHGVRKAKRMRVCRGLDVKRIKRHSRA